MADESRKIKGTVSTSSEDGKHQVAWMLLDRIAHGSSENDKTKDRDYWLNLYMECWHVVTHGTRKPS